MHIYNVVMFFSASLLTAFNGDEEKVSMAKLYVAVPAVCTNLMQNCLTFSKFSVPMLPDVSNMSRTLTGCGLEPHNDGIDCTALIKSSNAHGIQGGEKLIFKKTMGHLFACGRLIVLFP